MEDQVNLNEQLTVLSISLYFSSSPQYLPRIILPVRTGLIRDTEYGFP
jgi:hypothetical protein